MLIDFLAVPERLGVRDGSVQLRVSGAGERAELRVTSWKPIALRNAPNGDLNVELELLDTAGRPLPGPGARLERRVTINRELSPGAK
jgi:hypothetical protein